MIGEPVDLARKAALVAEAFSPRVVARMNDYDFKVVKLSGEFVWHTHADTDEVFLVLAGEMEIGFRDRTVTLKAGELFVVPKGVEHITRAATECHALIIEPRRTMNTGDTGGALTAPNDVWI